MKKLLALLMALAMIASAFVGCGDTDSSNDNDDDKISAESADRDDVQNDNKNPDNNDSDDTDNGNETVNGDGNVDGDGDGNVDGDGDGNVDGDGDGNIDGDGDGNVDGDGNIDGDGDGNVDGDGNIDGDGDGSIDGDGEDTSVSIEGKVVITLIGATFANGKTTAAYDPDTLVSIVAPDRDGETFIAWKDSEGNVLERLNDYDFVATENVTLTAEYVKNTSEGELYIDTDDGKTYYVAGLGSWKGNTLVIPETYNGKPVTRIGTGVFKDNKDIINLTLPETIETIGNNAFENFSSLKNVNLPKSLSEVPEFWNCDSLTTVYYDINDVYANFYASVRRIIIGETVSKISISCGQLKDIEIPTNATSISVNTEYNHIYTINYKGTLDEWIQTDHGVGQYRLNCKGGIPDEYTVNVSTIQKGAFAGMKNLKKVILPANVSGDLEGLFSGSSLSSIVISEGITEIATSMFSGCYNLTEIKLPMSLNTIQEYAFSRCSALESIVLPPNVYSIYTGAFNYCTALASVTFPAGAESIPNVFEDCENLEEWTISPFVTEFGLFDTYPKKVNFIGTQTEWENGIGSKFSYIFSSAEIVFKANTIYDFESGLRFTSNGDGTCWVSIIPNTDVTEFVIPKENPNGDLVVWMPQRLFADNSTVVSVEIFAEIDTIPGGMFNNCPNLVSLTLHDGIEKVEDYAISDCNSLTDISLPEGLESFGEQSFNFDNLTKYNNAFYIGNDDNPYMVLVRATAETITECEIHPNTKIIAGGAFRSCQFLSGIAVPEGVITIGNSAFSECYNLINITIPDSVTNIGMWVFYGCSALTDITIPDGVTSIEGSAFYGCVTLTDITIPDGVTSIGEYAFSYCDNLTSITIPNSVINIGNQAFDYCDKLISINFKGTKNEWHAISDSVSIGYVDVIHCTDGDIQ